VRRGAAIVVLALLAAALAPGAQAHAQAAGARDDPLPMFGEYSFSETCCDVLKRVAPVWPYAADLPDNALVLVQVLVGKDGLVKDTRVVRSIPVLDDAAVAAIRQWVFNPGQVDGRPVPVWIIIPFRFRPKSVPQAPDARSDPRRALMQEITAIQAKGASVPSDTDTTLRRWIIQDALSLDPRPLVPAEAGAHFARGRRAQAGHGSRYGALRAVVEFSAALYEAPWWGPPYQHLGEALLRLDRKAEAIVCLELYLLTEPIAGDRAQVEKQLTALRKSRAAAR
jgi:TonB family protein